MSHDAPQPDDLNARHERFTALLLPAQRRIFGYILTLLPDRAAAEDVLQEVATVLWRKFDAFEPGSDFAAWAIRIAHLSVLEHRRRAARLPLPFTDETLARLGDRAQTLDRHAGELTDALHRCIGDLNERQRGLLTDRYDRGLNPRQIAQQASKAPQTVYRALHSVHRRLFECLQRAMSEGTA